jgi:hypothetical protein
MNRWKKKAAARWIAAILCMLLAIPTVPAFRAPVAQAAAGVADFAGEGTEDNPYLISTPQDLYRLRLVYQNYPFKYFRQTANIDLSGYANDDGGKGWEPIAWMANYGPPFQAYYDGGGYEITGLTINRPNDPAVGLFGEIGYYGVVANVHISGGSISGYQMVGAIAGVNYGTILNSSSSATIHGIAEVGGLVGQNQGVISSSAASATLNGSSEVGGLVGWNFGLVFDSHVTGMNSVTCVTYGTGCDISTNGTAVGGLAGANGYEAKIVKSSSSASVKGYSKVGGLVGENSNGEIIRSHASGNVFSPFGSWYIGGLVGENYQGIIHHSYAEGHVMGYEFTGGLVGENDAGEIAWSYATGPVEGASYEIGGLVGYNGGIIRHSYATGSVNGYSNVGGLAGTNNHTILRSYSTGDVQGSQLVGGLIGNQMSGTLEDSYTTGNVLAGEYAGGLMGNFNGTVKRSYASGSVPADGNGLVWGDFSGAFEHVYWNTDISGSLNSGTTSDGAQGLTAAQMTDPSSFPEWNFAEVWEMGAAGPVLRLDRTWLLEFIQQAADELDDADVGTQPGQYPIAAASSLQAAIEWALQAANQTSASYAELLEVYDLLDGELQLFRDSVIPMDVSLVLAETNLNDDVAYLTLDRHLSAAEIKLNPYRFGLSGTNVTFTDFSFESFPENTGRIIIWFSDAFASDQPVITLQPCALTIDGVPNGNASSIRLITAAAKTGLRASLLSEGGGDAVTVSHVVRFLPKSGADVNGDGVVNQVDILYLLRMMDPVIEQSQSYYP